MFFMARSLMCVETREGLGGSVFIVGEVVPLFERREQIVEVGRRTGLMGEQACDSIALPA